MSKRRYRSIEFKDVDWQGLGDQIQGERVVMAVDVGKEEFFATLLDAEAVALITFKWAHPGQTREVVRRTVELAQRWRVEVVMEPSGTYGDALAWQLEQAGVALYRVSPKRVHDAAEIYDGVPSLHDAKAAYLIGRLHLQGVSQRRPVAEAPRREMAAVLTRLRLSKARYQAARNRLEAALSRHWPELLGLFELDSVTLPALIAVYGDPAGVHADLPGAEALMHRVSHGHLRPQKIQAVLGSAGHSLGVPALGAERELLQWLGAEVAQARDELHGLEEGLRRQIARTPMLVRMGAVVGEVTAAVLIAALGSPQNYPAAERYTKAMGLNLTERSSGKHKGQLKITKRGPSVARFYLYFAALRLIAHDPLIKRWYERKIRRAGALKNKTVIELMRKLAKALWHIARGASFDARKLVDLRALAGG